MVGIIIEMTAASEKTIDRMASPAWLRSANRDIVTAASNNMSNALKQAASNPKFIDTGAGMRSITPRVVSAVHSQVEIVPYMSQLDHGVPPGALQAEEVYWGLMGKGRPFGWIHRKGGASIDTASNAAWKLALKIEKRGIRSRKGWIFNAAKRALRHRKFKQDISNALQQAWIRHIR